MDPVKAFFITAMGYVLIMDGPRVARALWHALTDPLPRPVTSTPPALE